MIRDDQGGWQCSRCGHHLLLDRLAQMEHVLRLSDMPGDTFSGAGMSVEAMALYIRNLEMRWMQDQRHIRQLEQLLQADVIQVREDVVCPS